MNDSAWPLLSLLTFAPLAGALVVALLPSRYPTAIRTTALVASLFSLGIAIRVWLGFEPHRLMFEERWTWIAALNVEYHLGVDGLSVTMVLLTALITPLALLVHWSIDRDVKLFFVLFLLLQTGMFGVFTALSFFHWFIFWELGLIPMFFLIRLWGAEERSYASLKFFLYTLAGSVTLLLSFLVLYLITGTFDFLELRQAATTGRLESLAGAWVSEWNERLGWQLSASAVLGLLFWGVFLGLAIKVPLWPFHTWLPDAHTQAPTGGSMVLAAILLKMGVYGFLRLVLPIFSVQVAARLPFLLFLALASVVLGAFAALAQSDFKRLVAYSSVNHMGYAMLGIFVVLAGAENVVDVVNEKAAALNGALLQMFNHGISSAALFFLVGVLYDRTHTRRLTDYGGLRAVMPVYAGVLGISMFSSLGLPGLNGFVGEFLIFKGLFPIATAWAAAATVGLVVTAVFLLNMMQQVCFGPLNERWRQLPDMTAREIFIAAVLLAFMFGLGVYPLPLLNASNESVLTLIQEAAGVLMP